MARVALTATEVRSRIVFLDVGKRLARRRRSDAGFEHLGEPSSSRSRCRYAATASLDFIHESME
jgi:hypothetical protein